MGIFFTKIYKDFIYSLSTGGYKMEWTRSLAKWESHLELDKDLAEHLSKLNKSEKELEDSFYKHFEFGTGGMRGEIGPGTNRMNIYTIRRSAEGLALYIVEQGQEAMQRGVQLLMFHAINHLGLLLKLLKQLANMELRLIYLMSCVQRQSFPLR
jgi:hypothetical protein